MKILITHPVKDEHLQLVRETAPGAQIVLTREEGEIETHMPDSNIIWGGKYAPHLLPQCQNLHFIQTTFAGVESLLVPELVEHPLQLVNARIHGTTIAEHVFMLMLALARQLPIMFKAQAETRWCKQEIKPGLLAGRTIGIIGYGTIGRAIGQRAKAFSMRVLGARRRPQADPWADEVFATQDIDKMLPLCDYVVLATPLTPETKHMLGEKEFALFKKNAILINIGRGKVVDEPALIRALEGGRLAGAGLDVFYEEPLAADSPLWQMPQVIITPHMAGQMPDYAENAAAIFIENLRRYLAKEPLLNVVDKKTGY